MGDSHCRPRVLADFYASAHTADNALGQVATDLENAYHGFYRGCSDFVPFLGADYGDIRKLQTDNLALNGFALDVANAFIAASGGHLDINALERSVEMISDPAEINTRLAWVSADRARAEMDRVAILLALAYRNDEGLREALRAALEHSANGDNEVYSATLVVLLGKDTIDAILDSVEFDDGMHPPDRPPAPDVVAIAQPIGMIVQSASRSGNQQARDIAGQYITDALNVEVTGFPLGEQWFDPPEARRRLGLLLTASDGDADWVAGAADAMLLGDGQRNSTETVYFNRVALEALADNNAAAHVYVAGGDLGSSQEERLRELLNADVELSSEGRLPGFWPEALRQEREHFNRLAGSVLESGLVAYPERFGDPFTTPAVADEAARAAEVYADIVNMVANDEDGNPFSRGGAFDDPLRNSLARIGSSTWMMDQIARDAAEGPAQGGTPNAIASVEVLDDFYSELIKSDEARHTLEMGSVAYMNVSIGESVEAMDAGSVRAAATSPSGTVLLPTGVFPVVDGAAAQVAALARAINGNEVSAAEAQDAAAQWFGDLTEGVTGAAGVVPVLAIPSALLGPLTNSGVTSLLEAPTETLGAGGTFVVETNDASVTAIHAVLLNDARFSDLSFDERQKVVFAVYERFTNRVGVQLTSGQELEPRS